MQKLTRSLSHTTAYFRRTRPFGSLAARRTQYDLTFLARLFKHQIDFSFLRSKFGLATPARSVRYRDLFATPFARVETVKNGLFCKIPRLMNVLTRKRSHLHLFFRKKHVFPITHHPTYAARHITTFLRSHSSGTTFDRRSVQTTPARRNGAAPQTVTEARLTGASNALSTYSRTIPHHSRGRHGLAWTGNKRVVRSHFSTARRVFF